MTPPAVKLETTSLKSHFGEFWQRQQVFRESILAKLREVGLDHLAQPIANCGSDCRIITCLNCFRWKKVYAECGNRFCPHCAPQKSRRRAEELLAWTKTLRQPKHVVLTSRNTKRLTRSHVSKQLRALARLRRLKLSKNWTAGCWTMEITNESRGWHLHFHLLIEARWIDAGKLARAWAKMIGQEDAAIVKVKDARSEDYLREVTKYVCKSEQLAAWNGYDIAELMLAMRGRRSFGVFGDAFGARKEWRAAIKEARRERSRCECGECNWQIQTELQAELGRI